jgi:ankyrin repeat protein
VNALDEDGMTALIDAAHSGHTDVVKELIRHGADPTLKNNENKTAADIARENGHDGLIKTLENALKK